MHFFECIDQIFKIMYFLTGPWDPQVMILIGPGALGMGSITYILIH